MTAMQPSARCCCDTLRAGCVVARLTIMFASVSAVVSVYAGSRSV